MAASRRRRRSRLRFPVRRVRAALLAAALAAPAAQASAPELEPGRELDRAEVEALEAWFPPLLWRHRQRIFHDGMRLEVGPARRDYSPPPVYREATQRNRGEARLGPHGTLVAYRAGRPFPADTIECGEDPDAGAKWIWNFVHRWQGLGVEARFRYTYWDQGEQRPLLYQGRTRAWLLKYRPEPRYAEHDGDILRGERRVVAARIDVEKPDEWAGARTLTFRYEASYGPPETAKLEDTWIYSPEIRRTRKISERQRYTAFAGTDFSFDDLFSFSGLPPQYEWRCIEERDVLAPMNTRMRGFPLAEDTRFGASGLSYADDRWEPRRAVVLEMVPKDPEHPYGRKEMWIDRQTAQPLYAFAFDRNGDLWKIIYHDHRWSEDDLDGIAAREWYPGWQEVPEPRDLRVISDSVLNVQTGTGNRIEFWDSRSPDPDPKQLRKLLNPTRLSR